MSATMKLSDYLIKIGRPIAYYPKLRKITGSTNATIFLCQFVYWTGKEESGDGWIYKTSEDIEEETGLSYDEQRNARKKLLEGKLIEERYARLEHQMYFRVCLDALNASWLEAQSPVPEHDFAALAKAESPHSLISNTENTTEITTSSEEQKKKTPSEKKNTLKKDLLSKAEPGWQLAAGLSSEEIAEHNRREAAEKEILDHYERSMNIPPSRGLQTGN